MRRIGGLLGICAFIVFWSTSFILGALRPNYSHVVNTISELGAASTSNAILWNIFGFIMPGVFMAIAGAIIAQSVSRKKSKMINLACVLLLIAGFSVAGQGICPAKMSDGIADTTSPSTLRHFIFSLVSGVTWALGALLLFRPMKQSPDWRGWHIVSILLVLLTLISSLALRGVIPEGLAQRIGDFFFLLWFLLMSARLIKLGSDKIL